MAKSSWWWTALLAMALVGCGARSSSDDPGQRALGVSSGGAAGSAVASACTAPVCDCDDCQALCECSGFDATTCAARCAGGGSGGSGASGGSSASGGAGGGAADCCQPHARPGCTDDAITLCVCNFDDFCCSGSWDTSCVRLVDELACGSCGGTLLGGSSGLGGTGSGGVSGGGSGPGGSHDGGSGNMAGEPGASGRGGTPAATAGAGGSGGTYDPGNCCGPHLEPGCTDQSIQECVCNVDAYCCSGAWDQVCVREAEAMGCAQCGASGGAGGAAGAAGAAGSAGFGSTWGGAAGTAGVSGAGGEAGPDNCCQASGEPGCALDDVESCVCDADPFCCETSWDSVCVREVTARACGTCEPASGGTGGSTSTGGTGGSAGTGGSTSTGGSAGTGGSTSTGGSAGTGGSTSTGGSAGTGGEPPAGCCSARSEAGCAPPEVESCVCGVDPFCCAVAWDAICVARVDAAGCGTCDPSTGGTGGTGGIGGSTSTGGSGGSTSTGGSAGTGGSTSTGGSGGAAGTAGSPDDLSRTDCCEPGGVPGCQNEPAADCVCTHDPYCCSTAWDAICVEEVDTLGCGTCAPSDALACLDTATSSCEECQCRACLDAKSSCNETLGCPEVLDCALQTGCTAFGCYLATTCRSVIEEWGGLVADATATALALAQCTSEASCDCP